MKMYNLMAKAILLTLSSHLIIGCGSEVQFAARETKSQDGEVSNPDKIDHGGGRTDETGTPVNNDPEGDANPSNPSTPRSPSDGGIEGETGVNTGEISDEHTGNPPVNQEETAGNNTGNTDDPGNPNKPGNPDNPGPDEYSEAISALFLSGELMGESITSDINKEFLNNNFQMTQPNIVQNYNVNKSQIARPISSQNYKQGTNGTPMAEDFRQQDEGLLDILIVVDDSGSMYNEQKSMADKFSNFIDQFQNVNWQVGIVTTSATKQTPTNCFGIGTKVRKSDPDALQKIKNHIQISTKGDIDERGFEVTVNALNCQDQWLRDGSTLAILYISDEDNCSNGVCTVAGESEISYVTNAIEQHRTLGTQARIYGIIDIPNDNRACSDPNVSEHVDGVKYLELITSATSNNGEVAKRVGSVCGNATEYTNTLRQMAKDVSTILKSQFELKGTPDTNSERVFVNNKLLTSGYTISSNIITFDPPPAKNAKISVEYSVGSSNRFDMVTLNDDPYRPSIEVTINGQVTKDYTFDLPSRRIYFDTPPVDFAEINVKYKHNINLPRDFKLEAGLDGKTISAKQNNKNLVIDNYNASTGIVTLVITPEEESLVVFSYKKLMPGNPVYEFSFSTPWGYVSELTAEDIDTGSPLSVVFDNGMIKFDSNDFILGRNVKIQYRDLSDRSNTIELSHPPEISSISIIGMDENNIEIPCDPGDIQVQGKKIKTSCNLEEAVKIEVKYQYKGNLKKQFQLKGISKPDDAKWTVWVNDVETKDYTRVGDFVSFKNDLPFGTKVKIRADIKKNK